MAEPLTIVSTGCPSCGGRAEPEAEDGVLKYVCSCGYEFGFRRLELEEDSCSLGIPEQTRRELNEPVFVQIGRRPE